MWGFKSNKKWIISWINLNVFWSHFYCICIFDQTTQNFKEIENKYMKYYSALTSVLKSAPSKYSLALLFEVALKRKKECQWNYQRMEVYVSVCIAFLVFYMLLYRIDLRSKERARLPFSQIQGMAKANVT